MKRPEMRTVSGALSGRVALGTMLFGTGIEEEKAFSLLKAHTCRPGAQIDTARSYASWLPGGAGASERTIGKWLKKEGRELREHLLLGTKGCLMPRGYNSTRGDLSPDRIRSELEESLEALCTDYIDLYWLHRDEEGRDAGEIMETMNCLVREGKIRYFGVSNWKASRILEADAWAAARGLQPISASQIQFGFGVCTPERWGDKSVVCMDSGEYAVYSRLQMPVYAYSAQSEGYFARILSGEREKLSKSTLAKYDSSVNQARAARLTELRDLCGKEGRVCPSPEFVSLEYCLRTPFPVVFIHGGSNRDRLISVTERERNPQNRICKEDWAYLLQDGDFGEEYFESQTMREDYGKKKI